MHAFRFGAIAAAFVVIVASAAPASACRLAGVEGATGGPSDIRMTTRAGQRCTLRHITIVDTGRGLRFLPTTVARRTAPAARGSTAWSHNRMTYRGRPNDAFAYRITDRFSRNYSIRMTVTR